MSVRVCLPSAGGRCVGSTTALPRSGCLFPVSKSSRVLRFRGEICRLRLRSLVAVQCIASDASSSSSSPSVIKDESVDKASAVKESAGVLDVESPVQDSSGDSVENSDDKDTGLTDAENDEDGGSTDAENDGTARKRTWESMQYIRDRRAEDWKRADSFLQKNGIFQARIVGFNRGGLVLNFYSIRAFLPYSQLSLARLPRDESKTVMDIGKELVGKVVPTMVIQVDRKNRKLVFSERKALWTQYASKIQIGSVLEGQVTGIVDYGAFVDVRFPDVARQERIPQLAWFT